ncbi:MAG: hypothetical protein EOM41_08540 [Bacilli bacterium]|nr:hypothetical protein [Bacilli bacterium]
MISKLAEKRELLFILFLTIVGLILRLKGITLNSLWLDEIFSLKFSDPSQDIIYVLRSTLNDVHPALYQILLWFFYKIFGYAEFSGRYLSAIFGTMLIPATYFLAKKLFNSETGGVSALFIAINYYLIVFSQETRSYSLLALLTVISFYYLLVFIEKRNASSCVVYSIIASLLINTHYFSVLVLFVQFLVFISHAIEHRDMKLFKLGCVSCLSVIVSLLPSVYYVIKNIQRGGFWIQPPKPNFLITFANTYLGSPNLFFVFSLLYAFGLFFLVYEKPLKKQAFLLFSWVFIPLVLIYIKSLAGVPFLIERYFIYIIPSFLITCALSVSKLNSVQNKFVLLFIILSLSFSCLHFEKKIYTASNLKQGWNKVIDNLVVDRKKQNIPVYANLSLLYATYFKVKNINNIELKDFNDVLLDEIKTNKNPDAFYVLDAHNMIVKNQLSNYKNITLIDEKSFNGAALYIYVKKDYLVKHNTENLKQTSQGMLINTNDLSKTNINDFYIASGHDPFFIANLSSKINTNNTSNIAFDFKCKDSTKEIPIQIFWGNDKLPFNEKHSIRITIKSGINSINLSNLPSWLQSNEVTKIRFDIESSNYCNVFSLNQITTGSY